MIKLSKVIGKDIAGYIEVLERLFPYTPIKKVLAITEMGFEYFLRH